MNYEYMTRGSLLHIKEEAKLIRGAFFEKHTAEHWSLLIQFRGLHRQFYIGWKRDSAPWSTIRHIFNHFARCNEVEMDEYFEQSVYPKWRS
jgi:hypothetical protein